MAYRQSLLGGACSALATYVLLLSNWRFLMQQVSLGPGEVCRKCAPLLFPYSYLNILYASALSTELWLKFCIAARLRYAALPLRSSAARYRWDVSRRSQQRRRSRLGSFDNYEEVNQISHLNPLRGSFSVLSRWKFTIRVSC